MGKRVVEVRVVITLLAHTAAPVRVTPGRYTVQDLHNGLYALSGIATLPSFTLTYLEFDQFMAARHIEPVSVKP